MNAIAPAWVKLTTSQKEARRRAAARDLRRGVPQVEVARKYGVAPQTVFLWKQALEAEGLAGLRSKPRAGRPAKLSEKQCDDLVRFLLAGPRQHGFATDAWNGTRVGQVIRQEFGVEYHRAHISRLLHRLGFRPRLPDREAIEKDPAAKREWLERTWEYAKKN